MKAFFYRRCPSRLSITEKGGHPRGQILLGAAVLVAVMLILVPLMVQWSRNESHWSVKEQRSVTAFNLAEAAVDRGLFKLKSATSTWASAATGTAIAGYNFDVTYGDIPGGVYRVRFSSGPAIDQVTIIGEGKDVASGQVRAIEAIYENLAVPGPLMSGGQVNYSGTLECHWGPVMSHGNIVLSASAATDYFPRKLTRQVVTGTAGNPRDTNGLTPPNTDAVEWWSDFPVPDLPILDFTTMRASAAANGTLNYRTNDNTSGVGKCVGWATHDTCSSGGATAASHFSATNYHFHDSHHKANSKNNLIWYWDNTYDVTFSGGGLLSGHSNGLYGIIVVRGNATVDDEDNYTYVGPVPANAWEEYTRIAAATFDTAALNQYPADNGLRTNRLTFNHGGETWTGGPAAGAYTDVGFRGFFYVGGGLTINEPCDFAGTLWVVGNVTNTSATEIPAIFYEGNNSLLPVLNVVVVRRSWNEVPSRAVPWP